MNVWGPVLLAAGDAYLITTPTGAGIVVNALAVAALVARLRFPITVLLLTLPGVYMGTSYVAGLIALYTVARLRLERWLGVVCGMAVALASFLLYPLHSMGEVGGHRLWMQAEVSVGTTVAAVALARVVALRAELGARLADLTRSRRSEARLMAEHALAHERAQLAREMHDVVAHQVSLVSLQAGALRMHSGDPTVREIAGTIRTLSVRTLEELRHMVGVLRAAGGDTGQLTPQPALADLPRLLAESALDIDADIDAAAGAHCPATVERAAYRIVQEALTNVRKHAPGAGVHVTVARRADELYIAVRNGPACPEAQPLDLPTGGHGLLGLSERVHLLGGFFTAGPTPEGGFLVTATLPTEQS
ncbi:sensor histidine kinase [Streptomyces sp. URMC 123]|uniref:sensor histidine kinase n=1 Tax=Streptomyces sp. URMC 123 TaxID=3423403 RepID=UPI003F1DD0D5